MGRWLGYVLLVLLVLDQALKGGFSPVFFVAATTFLTGAVLYGLSGRVVLAGHSRARLRRYFRPCLLGLLLCIGLALLHGWLSEVNRPP